MGKKSQSRKKEKSSNTSKTNLRQAKETLEKNPKLKKELEQKLNMTRGQMIKYLSSHTLSELKEKIGREVPENRVIIPKEEVEARRKKMDRKVQEKIEQGKEIEKERQKEIKRLQEEYKKKIENKEARARDYAVERIKRMDDERLKQYNSQRELTNKILKEILKEIEKSKALSKPKITKEGFYSGIRRERKNNPELAEKMKKVKKET